MAAIKVEQILDRRPHAGNRRRRRVRQFVDRRVRSAGSRFERNFVADVLDRVETRPGGFVGLHKPEYWVGRLCSGDRRDGRHGGHSSGGDGAEEQSAPVGNCVHCVFFSLSNSFRKASTNSLARVRVWPTANWIRSNSSELIFSSIVPAVSAPTRADNPLRRQRQHFL